MRKKGLEISQNLEIWRERERERLLEKLFFQK